MKMTAEKCPRDRLVAGLHWLTRGGQTAFLSTAATMS